MDNSNNGRGNLFALVTTEVFDQLKSADPAPRISKEEKMSIAYRGWPEKALCPTFVLIMFAETIFLYAKSNYLQPAPSFIRAVKRPFYFFF